MLTALQLIKEELKASREVFEGTAADILVKHLHKDPGGKAFPLAATYAHLIFSEDAIVHGMLQGKKSLSETTWKNKTGVDSVMPAMDDNYAKANEKWSKTVKMDLPKFRKYANAVHKATDAYVKKLKNSDLEKEVDLGSWGKRKVVFLLYEYIIGHTYSLAGELSVLKGIQGVKGYPF